MNLFRTPLARIACGLSTAMVIAVAVAFVAWYGLSAAWDSGLLFGTELAARHSLGSAALVSGACAFACVAMPSVYEAMQALKDFAIRVIPDSLRQALPAIVAYGFAAALAVWFVCLS
jgi:hypothetical protein